MNDLEKVLKALTNKSTEKKGYSAQAVVTRTDGNTVYAKISGSDIETPCQKTLNCKVGDTVKVRVDNGKCWITGNYTAPPTDDSTTNGVVSDLENNTSDFIDHINAGKVTTGKLQDKKGDFVIDLDNSKITLRNALEIISKYFTLTKEGKIKAVDGEFSGEIDATSGNIGGWTIGSNSISRNNTNGNYSLSLTNEGLIAKTITTKNNVSVSASYSEYFANEFHRGSQIYRLSGSGGGISFNYTSGTYSVTLLEMAMDPTGTSTGTRDISLNYMNLKVYNGFYIDVDATGTNSNSVLRSTNTAGYLNLSSQSTLSGAVGILAHHNNSGTNCWISYLDSSGVIHHPTSSDKRLKENIIAMSEEEALQLLNNIEPKTFNYINGDVKYNGFLAQDVKDVLKDGIGYRGYLGIQKGEDNITDLDELEEIVTYSLDYSKMLPILWKGWQIHEAKIQEQQKQIDNLTARLEKLEALLKEA